MTEPSPDVAILAQGGFQRMQEMHRVLKARGIVAELVAPPGGSGKG